jgi:minor extracellular serine protease Vpr
VGATYNNLTSSQVATLTVNGMPFVVIPMLDSVMPAEPIDAPVVFGEYARERDLAGINATGAVVLAERGSDTAGELLYFSIKEGNAADAGAAAIIVFNNEEGIFHGELIHEFNEAGYVPRIPAVSMNREDGLEVLEMTRDGARAVLNFLLDPDHPVPFSSRGPVSPFYAKPDIMAPGVYINTTALSGYGAVSGTSYATPHVSGAAALLMQQNPRLSSEDVRSILVSTSSEVTGQTGLRAPLDDAGSGRLNVTAALSAGLVVEPTAVVASVTPNEPWVTVPIDMRPLDGNLGDISVEYDVPGADVSYSLFNSTLLLHLGSDRTVEGRLEVTHQDTLYTIPILLWHTEGTVATSQDGGRLRFEVSHPDGWSFAKITVTGRGGEEYRTSIAPNRPSHIDVYENGLYYVQADIVTGSRGTAAYDTIMVDTAIPDAAPLQGIPDIPWRQVAIAAAIAGVVGVAARVMPAGQRPLYLAGRR